jgi:predicted nucleotide-binding protein
VIPFFNSVKPNPLLMELAIKFLRVRLDDLDLFDPNFVKNRADPEIHALEKKIAQTITTVFGNETPEFHRYMPATKLDTARISYAFRVPRKEVIAGLVCGKERAMAMLNQAIQFLNEKLTDWSETAEGREMAGRHVVTEVVTTVRAMPKDVFIVHGYDEVAKVEVARLVERAGLNAIILHEQVNGGATIIEKFEKHGSAAGFAIVLATPDDVGGPTSAELHPRARQNVIGEMFWFAGRLGRDRVCVLVKGSVEMPSDFAGVGYTAMDDRGVWKQKLLRELDAAGYSEIDWKRALA